MVSVIFVALTVLLNIAAQVTLKISSKSGSGFFGFVNFQFIIAAGLYGLGLLTWTLALKNIPLSIAYPFMALAVIGVPIASLLFLGETLSWQQWIFLVLVLIGLVGFHFSRSI